LPDNEDDQEIVYGNDELETGVFSLIISWVQSLMADGVSDEAAREKVASYLDEVSEALRSYNKAEGNTSND
jgi:uncharacterized protein YoaH (UPF0181 family)